jgi:glutamine amidotransferase
MKVVIIDYGAGNTQSVKFAFNRLGINPVLSSNANEIVTADKVIFPGVGHASSAMAALRANGLNTVIKNLRQPVLGICLGMQLLCNHSEEGHTDCLGIINETVRLFEPKLKVPHMGWNTTTGNWLMPGTAANWFYFVHSYYVPVCTATTLGCDYITPFSAAVQKDNFYGTQFHPEKSGAAGETLLRKFIELT